MLEELTIKNFAIIDDLYVSFTSGMTVMSGETGAGKSIIINAVNLILGTRASAKLVRTGEEAAEIEAFFSVAEKSPTAELLARNGYDSSEGLLIRRIISVNNRHKIFINGSMATMQILSEITDNLASISGQHAHQGLLKEEQHLLYLDQSASLMPLRAKTEKAYYQLTESLNQYQKLKKQEKTQADQTELLSFQKSEIESASLGQNEDSELEQERERLKNSTLLMETVKTSQQVLYHMDGSVSERLHLIKTDLEKAEAIDGKLKPSLEELTELIYRAEDLSSALRDYEAGIETDPNRLEIVEERIDLINKLKRKYGDADGSIDAIETRYKEICSALSSIQNLTEDLAETEKRLKTLYNSAKDLATQLSEKRKAAAETLSKKVEKELSRLEMGGTQFKVDLSPALTDSGNTWLTVNGASLTETGIDKAVFMISPNVGEAMKPLAGIASGGELSRIVLALKAILAGNDATGTIVFDEVDSGIGGRTAELVGKKIKSLSEKHQIICITHLPQIARFGDQHYKIEKSVSKGRTSTTITPLDEPDRVREIARMLGGVEITDTIINHAKELINTAS